MKIIPIESDEHWHGLRQRTIGSSEAAALFGRSPYFTRFSLWHAKAGLAEIPPPDHERLEWGTILEPAIAVGVAREMGWSLEQRRVYCVHDQVDGMGCTIDRFITDHEDGPGVVELKNVDWLVFKSDWSPKRAPWHIEMQLQHQLSVTGYGWGAIGVLVGGNDLKIYPRRPDADAIAELEEAVASFWASIREGRRPNAFGDHSELATLAHLFPAVVATKRLNLTDDDLLSELAAQFMWAGEQRRAAERVENAAKSQLISAMGDAEIAYVDGAMLKLLKIPIAARTQNVKEHVQQRLTAKPLDAMPTNLGERPPEPDALELDVKPLPAGDASPFI